jgi:hypothetical protein
MFAIKLPELSRFTNVLAVLADVASVFTVVTAPSLIFKLSEK